MQDKVIIEVRLSDIPADGVMPDQHSKGSQGYYISHVIHFLNEQIGGAICFNHFCLPQLETKFFDSHWVIEVSCCCFRHSDHIQQRLTKLFKK